MDCFGKSKPDMNQRSAALSCFIRTLNEERTIGRVIAAVREAASEVVVIDSGSTDDTVRIAEAEGARVVHQPWLGNGRQKRVGEEQCSNDFVLDLDADEIVTPALAREIRQLFSGGPPPRPIYELRLVTVPPIGKRWSRIAVRYPRKLYDRRVVRAPDHKAWDQFTVPDGVEVGRLSGDLEHHSFRDLAHLMYKLNRMSTARARDGRKQGLLALRLRVLFMFPFYFLKHYLFRQHFRAGVYGFVIAMTAAYGRWSRDAKQCEQILSDRVPSQRARDRR
jgi:glycosyltransferase involved in cell wall biosynthesis